MEFLMLSAEEIKSSVTVRLVISAVGNMLLQQTKLTTRFWAESQLKVLIEFLCLTGAAWSPLARDSRAV